MSQNNNLKQSNSRISITLDNPTNNDSFNPGETLSCRIAISSGTEYTKLSLSLKGTTTATIMGKDRWQAGQLSNIGMGGSGMLITSQETLTFLDMDIPLLSPAPSDFKAGGSSKEGSYNAESGVYTFQIPFNSHGQLLPSYTRILDDATGVEVKYLLELHGSRSGFFKSNDKLELEIPVSIPIGGPDPNSLEPNLWPSTANLPSFKNGDIVLTHRPLSTTSDILCFRILIPPGLLPPSLQPTVVATLSRRTRTTPEDKNLGKSFNWAGVRVAKGEVKRVGNDEWEGSVSVPKGQHTIESKGVGIRYMVGCQISSRDTSPPLALSTSMPVFIPSSSVRGEATRQVEWEDDLPPYTA
ncbi:hypothetical protein T439DRAFT_322098 [Meredithblackwellia eburnea MCA 4105]